MKKVYFILFAVMSLSSVSARDNVIDTKFRRSSLYTLKLDIPKSKEVYDDAIRIMNATYDTLSTPDAYNNFNLTQRHINYPSLKDVSKEEIAKYSKSGKAGGGFARFAKGMAGDLVSSAGVEINTDVVTEEEYVAKIMNWFNDNDIAKQLVAKWHNKKGTSTAKLDCDDNLEVLTDLGLVGLSEEDKDIILQAGGSLASAAKDNEVDVIGNTYVIVNRFAFVSGDELFKDISAPIMAQIQGANALIALGLQKTLDAMRKKYANGYYVRAYAYLFQLQYGEEEFSDFNTNYWNNPTAFQNAKYTLNYLGKSSGFAHADKTNDGHVVSVALRRAMDKCYADLQHDNPQFRPMAALHTSDDGSSLFAYVGAKEGVTEKSQFDVFEARADKNGKLTYQKIGSLKVASGQVWDNRVNAKEFGASDDSEKAGKSNANLQYTTFQGKPGKFGDGHLIRLAK